MLLYHVTGQDYSPNKVIQAKLRVSASKVSWVDKLLDSGKPDSCPRRQKSLFAFDDLAFCHIYARAEELDSMKFYEVEMENPCRCPMVLVDYAAKQGKSNIPNSVVQEYWDPSKDWKMIEYLAESMTVIKEVEAPDLMEQLTAKHSHQKDFDLAKEINWD